MAPPRYKAPWPFLPELVYAGSSQHRRASKLGLGLHRHAAMEFCYIERGKVRLQAGAKLIDVSGGQVCVFWPGEAHGGVHDILEPCRIHWLGLELEARPGRSRRQWLDLPAKEGRALAKELRSLKNRRFSVPAALARQFQRLCDQSSRAAQALDQVEVRAAILDILCSFLRAGQPQRPARLSPMVEATLKLMEGNLAQPLPLPTLAKKLGWGIAHFKNRFRQEMGVPPAEYYLRLRLTEAQARLEGTGASITQIALDLGFSSSQYFATAFKRRIGLSPQSFRGKK